MTQAQQIIYEAMCNGEKAYYMEGIDSYWFIFKPRYRRCTKQIEALIKQGKVRVNKKNWNNITAEAVQP